MYKKRDFNMKYLKNGTETNDVKFYELPVYIIARNITAIILMQFVEKFMTI